LIVPENSGLRPATPPKEFLGGFGSSKGSPFSSYNPKTSGGSGTGLENAEQPTGETATRKPRKGKKGRRGKRPPPTPKQEPEFKGLFLIKMGDDYGVLGESCLWGLNLRILLVFVKTKNFAAPYLSINLMYHC
jgi:hypothetical protein